jgi:hypothetical protein
MSYLNEVNNLTDSDSLRQGENFQGRLDYYTNIQENFDTTTGENQSDATDKIISNNNTYVKNKVNNSEKYDKYLGEYTAHKNDLVNKRQQYNYRKDISNIYLNKNIKFSNGKIFHVTNQGVARHVPNDKVKNILGKNGCSSTIMDINIPWDDKYLIKGAVIPTKPTLITGTVMKENGSCGNEGKNVRVTQIVSDISDKFVGCFKDDVNNPKMKMMGNVPYIKKNEFTFDDCKNFAIDGGNKYFALQHVNPKTEKGFCAVSNNITNAIKTAGLIPNQAVEIWKAQVSPVPGTMARITKNGSLEIITTSGTTIFSTPSLVTDPLSSNYVGCYNDNGDRALSKFVGRKSFAGCNDYSVKNNHDYFGLQYLNGDPSLTTAECWVNSDVTSATKYGKTENCRKMNDGMMSGLGWANAVYSSRKDGNNYFLMIEDNGNVSIYKGSNINDKQELIWQTGTSGKTIEKNDKYKASKCKFGSHIMKSGATLASGEFIGSPSGSCYLMMNPDGNLVLYTSKTTSGCFDLKNNKQAGLTGMNSIYELAQTGDKTKIGSLMYIDEDGNTADYPESKLKYGDTFTELQNYESSGNDIGQCKKPTIDECLTECKNNKNCYAMNSGKWMKNKHFMKNLYPLKNSKMFIRDKMVVEGFSGDNKDIPPVDTYKFNNYSPSNINNVDSISRSISARDNYIKQLKQNNLNSLEKTSNTDIITAQTNYIAANNQLGDNHKSISNYHSEYNVNDGKFETGNKYLNDYNRIVDDSNMVLLQENRLYIFLFIFLILSLIIFIQVLKLNKQ